MSESEEEREKLLCFICMEYNDCDCACSECMNSFGAVQCISCEGYYTHGLEGGKWTKPCDLCDPRYIAAFAEAAKKAEEEKAAAEKKAEEAKKK